MSTQVAAPATKHRKAAKSAIRAARKHSPAVGKDSADTAAFQAQMAELLASLQQGGDDSALMDGPDADDDDGSDADAGIGDTL